MTRTIEVSEETYEKIREQLGEEAACEVEDMKDLVGKAFFFRECGLKDGEEYAPEAQGDAERERQLDAGE